MLKVKSSRVDKLQVELSSQRERLEEASRLSAKLKVSTRNHHIVSNLNLVLFLASLWCYTEPENKANTYNVGG